MDDVAGNQKIRVINLPNLAVIKDGTKGNSMKADNSLTKNTRLADHINLYVTHHLLLGNNDQIIILNKKFTNIVNE